MTAVECPWLLDSALTERRYRKRAANRITPMKMIYNPVIRGFNPDPSFIRAGDDYYIANSTFEWFPGVQIHHSKDLVHWRLIGHALTRTSQLDLRGVGDSGGVWAPSMSYHD